MKKLLHNKIFWLYLLELIVSVFLGKSISNQWLFLSFFWAGLCILSYQVGFNRLNKPSQLVFLTISLSYPMIEIGIKLFILFNVIPYPYVYLNFFEHAFWAFSFLLVAMPIFGDELGKGSSSRVFKLVFCLGLISIIGNANELLQWQVREVSNLHNLFYYPDTMHDLIANFVGGFSGFALLLFTKHF